MKSNQLDPELYHPHLEKISSNHPNQLLEYQADHHPKGFHPAEPNISYCFLLLESDKVA
ncbi:MAG: hypothetical protein Q8S84_06980 [bacterium]|nr:hypothetical protein [bacterium]MDP3381201.1 hypothetical protein [bacterium]